MRISRLILSREHPEEGPEAAGLVVRGGRNVQVDHCWFYGHPLCGILFSAGSGAVEANVFRECGKAAVVSVEADVTMEANDLEAGLEALVQGRP